MERRLPADPSGEVTAMNLGDLMVTYGTWRGRFISRRPRKVHVSRELAKALRSSEHAPVIKAICDALESGDDLTPRLSEDVRIAHLPKRKRRKSGRSARRNVDTMLAHDGLHHLHLGVGTGTFVPRIDDLLLLAIRDEDAYLIGIYPHGTWGHTHVLRRMIRNWPDVGLALKIESVVGVEHELTDAERWELMKAGVSIGPIEVDGAFYGLASLGQTGAGTPVTVSRRVMALTWEITLIRERGISQRLSELGEDPSGYWVPAVQDERLGLERSTRFVPLGRLA
jgi:hypothetical protein